LDATQRTKEPRRVDLGVDTNAAAESDLIPLSEAAKLVRGRRHDHVNVQVMQRYASPLKGRVFVVRGEPVRLVLPTAARGCGRYTTAAWVELWKRKFNELASAAREAAPAPLTPRQRRRQCERAAERLRQEGFPVGG
jgi:hypothetical protein